MYPVTDEFLYMCQSVDEFRLVSDGYPINVGDSNPKMYEGMLQGFLSYPKKGIDFANGGYYDRDPRIGHTLTWNGVIGEGTGNTGESWDNDSGTHFLAEEGEVIPSFVPGIVTGVYPNQPDNWVLISTDTSQSFDIGLAHSSEVLVSVGQRISGYQPVAKAGHKGYPNTMVHLALARNNYGYEILDPYKPVYAIDPKTYGCWTPPPNVSFAKHDVWLSLPTSQNYNWDNYWIVEDQTHF